MGRLKAKFFAPTSVQEIPSGLVDGSNVTFTLANSPASPNSVYLTLNGLSLVQGLDYTVGGVGNQTITMTTAPTLGQKLYTDYLKAN